MKNLFSVHHSNNVSYPKRVLVGYTLVAENSYLKFIEQVGLHFDAGWEPAGDVQLLNHNHWEEPEPLPEQRFCLQLVMHEIVNRPEGRSDGADSTSSSSSKKTPTDFCH